MKTKKYFTLITGASQGIGRALAYECAGKGMNLFLVALPNRWLDETVQEIINQYPVDVISYGIDLTDDEAPVMVHEFAKINNIEVNVLINNAGFGTSGLFERSDFKVNNRMIKLNNLAFVALTHCFLEDLSRNAPSYLLNMSSMEATLPLPYKAVYTGTKNFIYAFTLALKEELRGTDVNVSVICPGPVLTNADGLKRIKSQGLKARLLVRMPHEVARYAIQKMYDKKTVLVPGLFPRLILFLGCLIPRALKMRALERLFRVYRDHVPDPRFFIPENEEKREMVNHYPDKG